MDGHWAKNEIEYLYDAGIILGKQDNIFAPEDKITRAEFLALIIRALSIDETDYSGTTFIDVSSDDWYSTAIETGLKLGLIAEDDFFRPNDPVNREEMVKMIIEAYIIKKEIIITDEYQSDYADEADISSWAIEYVNQADYLNLVKGVGNGRFAPKENATRAQAAVIIKRLLEKIM